MSLEKTEAIILKSFNWSESSRTVVFFTEQAGKLPLVDKGGRSFKSRRGRLIPFARMEITYYSSQKESRGYISEVALLEHFSLEKSGSLGRLAFASAACELLYLLLPDEEPQGNLYDYFRAFLGYVETADKHCLSALFLAFFLRVLSHLGYNPSLAYCVLCRRDLDTMGEKADQVLFSPARGGIICSACQKAGDYYIPFSSASYKLLLALQTASLKEAVTLPIGYQETVLLLEALAKFVSYQTGITSDLKSLKFLEKLKNSELLR